MRVLAVSLILLAACDLDFQRMLRQRRVNVSGDDPERIALVEKGDLSVGAVAYQSPASGPLLGDGCIGGQYADVVPIELPTDVVARGIQTFSRMCAACHGPTGNGISPVAQAMEKTKPSSLLLPPVRGYAAGRIYRTVIFGYKLMPTYRDVVTVRDAWAVTTYVKSWMAANAGGDLGTVQAAASPGPVCPEGEP